MRPFHLSTGTREIEEELKFFQSLGALITHRDESGYINIELFGSQITLKSEPNIELNLKNMHFGYNLNHNEFLDINSKLKGSEREKRFL